MLTQLSIKNIVLIESCAISLGHGLCVLSGETGAGKSILLDALGLVLGARADSGLIRSGEAQGSVTAEFDISGNEPAKHILRELELEASDSIIIRRSVTSDGKTRCFINDQAVSVSGLKKLGESLVEIHGQHDQRSLMDASAHRTMLDYYAGLAAEQSKVAQKYRAWKVARDDIAKLQEIIETTSREKDYLEHMRSELKLLAPELGEEDELTSKRTTMMQSEKLFEVLNESIAELNAGKGVIAALRSAQRTLMRSTLTTADIYQPIIDTLDRAAIDAEEASYALEKAGQAAVYDPVKLEEIEERLFALKAAGRKYNMPADELASLKVEVEDKLTLLDTQHQQMKKLREQEQEAKKDFLSLAEKLSEVRNKTSKKLEKSIESELAPLKMEGTKFQVRVEKQDESSWSEYGIDGVYFECATNVSKGAKNIAYASLNKIASGGELSRFMLAMKVALAAGKQSATLIFDEIDTGTGGAVAAAIGARLAKLGQSAQVLVVTHLPQVAARGSQHLLVSKQEKAKKITTAVKTLSQKEREEELARMLAGATITPEARKAAQKLLEQAA